MIKRLETASKDLSARIAASEPMTQRRVSIVACELAIQATELDIPIISESLEQLRQNGKLPQERIVELNKLANQLDERYFDIQDALGDNTENSEALQVESLQFFGKARAVSALEFAGEENTYDAAMESVYEALAIFEDRNNFFSEIEKAF